MIAGVLFFALLTCYVGIQLYFLWVWSKNDPEYESESEGPLPFVSLIIPVRNEEENIARCLRSVTTQHYPTTRLQVIVVDDHSTDRTIGRIQAFPQVEIAYLAEGCYGKKMAIHKGVEVAKGEVVITIDGDCEVGEGWLASMVSNLSQDRDSLVTGPVWMVPASTSFIEKYQEMEQAALNVLTYSGLTSGLILSASGANMGYSKSLYSRLDPYADNHDIPSGDDVFFAQKVFWSHGRVRYVRLPEAIVFTDPVSTFSSFVSQRMRWAGKSSGYSHGLTQLYLALFVVVNVSFLVLLIAGIWYPVLYLLAGLGLVLKFILDYLIISTGMRWGQRPVCWQDALKASLFQIVYVNYMAVLMVAGKKTPWKGRT